MLTPTELHVRAAAMIDHAAKLGMDELDSMACFDLAIRALGHAQGRKGVFVPNPPPKVEEKPQ